VDLISSINLPRVKARIVFLLCVVSVLLNSLGLYHILCNWVTTSIQGRHGAGRGWTPSRVPSVGGVTYTWVVNPRKNAKNWVTSISSVVTVLRWNFVFVLFKLKISQDILISVFTPSRLHLLSKTSWASVFRHKFFHSHPLNEMFIVNLIAVTILLLTSALHRKELRCQNQHFIKSKSNLI